MSRASRHAYFDPPFAAMAHRGGWVEPQDAPRENTLFAFQTAADLGFRYAETDVHTTADGTLIAFHDKVLDRVTEDSGVIAQLPWDRVREARINGTDPIPTLDELLEALPRTRFNIDIKAPGAVEPLYRAIERHNAWERVCIASFSERRLGRFRKLAAGRVATSMSSPAVGWGRLATPLARHVSLPGHVFQVPFEQRIGTRSLRVVTPEFLAMAHDHDMRVHVWTVNDERLMAHLLDMGVDGIITDRPALLKDVLVAHGKWAES